MHRKRRQAVSHDNRQIDTARMRPARIRASVGAESSLSLRPQIRALQVAIAIHGGGCAATRIRVRDLAQLRA